MKNRKSHELDFEEYVRNVEPSKREKSDAWFAAIGLQQVDGLTPSKYLYKVARQNIDGEISIDDAQKLVNSYYESKIARNDDDDDAEEADKVSARIAKILSEKSFNFSPSYLIAIHGKLFQGIYKFAGRIRDYDITKKEWVLNGDTVMYGAAFELKMALDYDFDQERNFAYGGLSMEQIVEHLAFFVSRLWQIHAFGEGNTRTTAVFTIKYLRSMGFKVSNEIFAKNSWYFRNALVRANYKNLQKGIDRNPEFLEKFFRNMLMGERNELKNRFMHLDFTNRKPTIELKKPTIGLQKPMIDNEKPTIDVKKAKIELAVEESSFNKTAKENMLKFIRGVEIDEMFGASRVREIVACGASSASAALKRLLSLQLIEPVSGHGKSKFRFKE